MLAAGLILIGGLVVALIYVPWSALAVILFGVGMLFPVLFLDVSMIPSDGPIEGVGEWSGIGVVSAVLILCGMFAAFDGIEWWFFAPPALCVLGLAFWGSERFKPVRDRRFKLFRLRVSLQNYVHQGSVYQYDSTNKFSSLRDWSEVCAAAREFGEHGWSRKFLSDLIRAWDKAAETKDVEALDACQETLLTLGWTPQTPEHRERMDLADRIKNRSARKEEKPSAPEDDDERDVQILTELCEAYATNDQNSIKRLEKAATRIGRKLDKRGGIEEMRRIFHLVPDLQGKRTLDMYWGGIGDWLG